MAQELDKASAILLKKYFEGRNKNARWSQRAFAKRVGLSSGALSEIFQGKRKLSAQLKKKVAEKLDLSPLEEMEFFEQELPNHLKKNGVEYHLLDADHTHLISEWWHFAILNLVKTKDFEPQPKWIASRLGMSLVTVEEAWDRLFRLGYLNKTGDKIVRKHPRLKTSDGIVSSAVQSAHIQDTKLIEKAIKEVAVDLRDHTSMTLVMNKENMARAKEMIRLFQDRFSEEVETPVGEEVYRLSMAFFPLTKTKEATCV
ncbi:MAG: TIGR02147 family protein [Bdellovibrionales bacterium]|nr:TIGR02147 family protein [Bdellovibrionales bacterium]